jgi:hypothetical protein
VKTKKLAGAAAVGAVTAVTTLLLGATPAMAQDAKTDGAFALEASGLIDIPAISSVKSTDGKLVSDELLSIGDVAGAHEDALSFGLLTAEAEAHRAETAVKEINLFDLLRADLVRTWCKNGKGGLQVINGTILGKKIPDTAVPGHTIDLSPVATLKLNSQKRHPNGALTVTGLQLKVLPTASNLDEPLSGEEKNALPVVGDLLGKQLDTSSLSTVRDVVEGLDLPALGGDAQTVTIGSATCTEGASGSNDDADDNGGNGKDDDGDGKDDGDGNGKDDDGDGKDDGKGKDDDKDSKVKSAPAPSAVQAALAVTG